MARWFAVAELTLLVVLLVSSHWTERAVLTGGGPTTVTFTYTGGPQSFTVPPGVTSLSIDAQGAEGGGGPGAPGLGGDATATIAVASGDAVQVMVGGRGQIGAGGWNGGGAPGASSIPATPSGGGGGGSDTRVGPCAATLSCGLAARAVVAGGGGGADTSGLFAGEAGGAGGGASGGAGSDPGALGIAGSGGLAGGGGAGGGAGSAGAPGQGGAGGAAAGFGASGGGGGGGGYYGGGGGGGGGGAPAGGDGGGGSGFGPGGVVLTSGVNASDGVVSITYTASGSPTTTTVSGSSTPSPSAWGQPVTFTAVVSPVPAGGTVQFQVDGLDAGAPVAVDGSGQAVSAPTSTLAVGPHAVAALYGGDPTDLPSTSAGLPFAVVPAATTVAINAVPNPATVGQSVVYTAHVTVTAPGAGTPAGTVTFSDNGTDVAGCGGLALDASANAPCTIVESTAGAHNIGAAYTPSANFGPSAMLLVETVNAAGGPSPSPPPPTTSTTSTTTSTTVPPSTTASAPRPPSPPTTARRTSAPTTVPPTSTAPSTTVPASTTEPVTIPSTTSPTVSTGPGSAASPGAAGPPGGEMSPSPSTASGGSPAALPGVHLQFGFSVGAHITGSTATVTASGLEPGTSSTVVLHSIPTALATVTVEPDGTFTKVVTFPARIAAGAHHVDVVGVAANGQPVSGRWYLAVDHRGVVTRLDPTSRASAPGWVRTPFAVYVVAQHAPTTVATLVSGFALLALLTGGASLVHGASHNGGGSLASSKVKHAKRWQAEDGVGDHSGTWRWPGVAELDRVGASVSGRLGAASPLGARIAVDSAWLRAMFGTLWLAVPAIGLALGAAAVVEVRGAAIPPSLALVTAIVALSMFDSLAGLCAAATFTAGVVVTGGLTSANAVRGLLGLDMLLFVVPLIASAARPLRRQPGAKPSDWFDRVADVVIASLVAGWSTEKIVGGLSGLSGLTLPIGDHAQLVAVVVIGAMAVRMIGETMASWWYPSRLAAVTPEEIAPAGNRQQLVSLALQTLLMMFIAHAYLGNVWELYVGAALFAVPSIFQMYQHQVRNVPWLVRAIPKGIAKTTLMMIVGTWFAHFVAGRITNPARFITEGFIVLSVPGLVLSTMSLLGREGRKWELTWLARVAGIAVLALGILLAQKVVRIG